MPALLSLLRSPFTLALLCVLAGACDAFDEPGADADSPGVRDPAQGVSPPNQAPRFDAATCTPCGDPLLCSDCGSGCTCAGLSNTPTAWRPPLTNVGGDGWRSSVTPLCAGVQKVSGHSLWADARGVFAAVSGSGGPLTAVDDLPEDDGGVISKTLSPSEFAPLTRVLHNEGNGWTLHAALEGATAARVTAATPARVIIYGDRGQLGRACTLGVLAGGMLQCAELTSAVHKVHAVSKTRAFALSEQSLLENDGRGWTPVSPPLPASATDLWADADVLVVAGRLGNVHRLSVDGWHSDNVGEQVELTAIWGRSGDDLWTGSADGKLFHFDGSGWTRVAELGGRTCMSQLPILHISGGQNNVWIHTRAQLARWTGSALETFANWSCAPRDLEGEASENIDDLRAVSDDDVYVAFSNVTSQSACGDAFVVHWDGEQFHRF